MSDLPHHEETTPIENDPVWNLLENAPRQSAGPSFVNNVVRLARLDEARPRPWWEHWLSPVPATAMAGLAAAVIVGFVALRPAQEPSPEHVPLARTTGESEEARIAQIQEVLETEMLYAAIEHLDEFSDEELITLIGF